MIGAFEGEGMIARGTLSFRTTRLHPLGPDDLAVMPVAGGVLEHVALAFVELIKRQRVLVRYETIRRREVLVVTGDPGDAYAVDPAEKRKIRGGGVHHPPCT